jgi:hypothetical protein
MAIKIFHFRLLSWGIENSDYPLVQISIPILVYISKQIHLYLISRTLSTKYIFSKLLLLRNAVYHEKMPAISFPSDPYGNHGKIL